MSQIPPPHAGGAVALIATRWPNPSMAATMLLPPARATRTAVPKPSTNRQRVPPTAQDPPCAIGAAARGHRRQSRFQRSFPSLQYTGFTYSKYAAIYFLRECGVRLPKPKDPVSGELRLHPSPSWAQTTHKRFWRSWCGMDGGIVFPPLHGAMVRSVTKGGMAIRGTEIMSRGGFEGASAELPANLLVPSTHGECSPGSF